MSQEKKDTKYGNITVNKPALGYKLSEKFQGQLPDDLFKSFIEIVFLYIEEELLAGRPISIKNFGSFYIDLENNKRIVVFNPDKIFVKMVKDRSNRYKEKV